MVKESKKTSLTKDDLAVEKQAEVIVAAETTHKVNDLLETEAIAEEIVKVEKKLDAEEKTKKAVAKAGKRSAKAQKEAQELESKKQRKASLKSATDDNKSKPKVAIKPPRSKLERSGKKLRTATQLVDSKKLYDIAEASDLATKTSTTKFDSTVELHVNLNVDPRQADQNIRSTIVLPSGTGKSIKVAVLAETDDAKMASAAGAELTGLENIFADLDKEQINFDVLIATPSSMAKLSKYARLLGPKGLMPNPKSGTVTTDVVNAVKEAKAGRVEYRVDDYGIVHMPVGKVSFGSEKLSTNIQAVLDNLKTTKPNSIKGAYIKTAYLSTTMGPSIQLQITD